MKYDWSSMRKVFFMGLLLTGVGILLVMYTGWNEATLIYLGIGSLLLFCCLMVALFYGWMARVGNSRLPEGWDNLSAEARHDFAVQKATEASNQGNVSAKLSLWLMRLDDRLKRHIEARIAERDD